MMIITLEHKHCKTLHTIEGETITKAFKDNGIDKTYWTIISVEEN